jgi:NAD(P)-dependent dehydrogenase (short-subunit alcohol dehydrogenase family)
MMTLFAAPYAAAYGASKGGIVQLSRSLATAWAADNIQVNAILPGWIDTNLTRTARSQVAGLHERVLARTPAGRWGEPGDFAGIAVFWRAPRRISSPARRFRSTAAIRSRPDLQPIRNADTGFVLREIVVARDE